MQSYSKASHCTYKESRKNPAIYVPYVLHTCYHMVIVGERVRHFLG